MWKITLLFLTLLGCISLQAQADTYTNAKVTPILNDEGGLTVILANTSLSPLSLEKLNVSLDGGAKPECTFLFNQPIQLGAGEREELNVASSTAVQHCLTSGRITAVARGNLRFKRNMEVSPEPSVGEKETLQLGKEVKINASWLDHKNNPRSSRYRWSLSHE